MTVERWWELVKHKPFWSGSIVNTPWDELWDEARNNLSNIFHAAIKDEGSVNTESKPCPFCVAEYGIEMELSFFMNCHHYDPTT